MTLASGQGGHFFGQLRRHSPGQQHPQAQRRRLSRIGAALRRHCGQKAEAGDVFSLACSPRPSARVQ